ncbi:MAG: hypothetical protein UR15_C0012G0001 [Parcubacteria group bacterium GW2011_GWA2_31_28]|nr:MAG: hypothetical protein UR15_C0012G0001 [Parcubacteria group bacterium GW2011_GWA2_31_28]
MNHLTETYRLYAHAYNRLAKHCILYQELKNSHLKSTLESTEENARILDFEAGTGNLTFELLLKKIRVDAIDISQDMLTILRKKCDGLKRLHVFSKDILSLKNSVRKYDSVIAMNVIYHLNDPIRYLTKINTLMKSEASISVSGPNKKINVAHLFETIRFDLEPIHIGNKF